MSNPINWIEIPCTDLERAKTFYTKVFEIDLHYMEMPDSKMYLFGAPGNEGSSGALVQANEILPCLKGSTVYFSAKEIDHELSKVPDAGGEVLIPKTDIGEFGFYAHIKDSEGNRIGLYMNEAEASQ